MAAVPGHVPHPTLMLVQGYIAWIRARPREWWGRYMESAVLRVQRNYGPTAADTVRRGLTTALGLVAAKAR